MTSGTSEQEADSIEEWNVQMAGALIITIPSLLIYIFLGRYFIRGLLVGSVKG